MRATEIIRGILDLIDTIDCAQSVPVQPDIIVPIEEPIQTGVDTNRFKQIFDLLSQEHEQMYNNSPAEKVSGIESVTTQAGGGWNGPKNPADIRADSISMYPNHQHSPE
jgi:hypothetical protein